MRYDHEMREEWLSWFLDPRTDDRLELVEALQSVPLELEPWLFVETRLRVALDEAKAELLPPVSSGTPVRYRVYSDDEHRQWELLEEKERLFFEEVWRRRQVASQLVRR
ncbi:MAG: hypothetical protein HY332_20275 [Chloroflexi bacterium]|nr:hypothetical protein [Chloroflexota bacterium]